MRLVLAAEDGLNAVACDRLLARLEERKALPAREITVDLRQAAFVEPYGAACLVLLARRLAGRRQRLVCVLPSAANAQQAVSQMRLGEWLEPLGEVRHLRRPGLRSQDETTLPLSVVRSRADVQGVLDYLVAQVRGRLDYGLSDLLDATKVVSELCHNVVDHSGAEGLATASIFRDRTGRRFISLAVVDAGVGIRASLAQRYPEAEHWRHAEAIQRALDGLSSRPDSGGLGLRSVQAIVRRYEGRLAIRSGNDRLYVSAKRQARTVSGVLFPGTQVGISFSQR
jgi:anti-sigma regulatory factor (Ser/Thr protein kinase)